MPESCLDSSRYRDFVAERDRALERIHQHAQIDLSRLLHQALTEIERLAAQLALKSGRATPIVHQTTLHFDLGVREIMAQLIPNLYRRILNMRRAVFVLTYASEREAIGRATQRRKPLSRAEFKHRMDQAVKAPTLEGPLDQRIWRALMALRHRLVKPFELAIIMGKDPTEIVEAVRDAFPSIAVFKRPKRALTRVKEARYPLDDEPGAWFDSDFIDDDDWNLAVQAYKDTELPPTRFDNAAAWDPETGMMRYNWEVEQEATEDFVKQVRDGQVAAANDLGVQDFVWIAILDQKTCEDCCVPRAGKTSKEIEAMLASGQLDSDECDAITPPAHFKCRCQASPVATVDQVEGPDWQSFNDWLEAS